MDNKHLYFTARDITDVKFRPILRGYRARDVDDFLDKVTRDYATLYDEIDRLHDEVDKLRKELDK